MFKCLVNIILQIIDLGLGDPRMQALLNDPTTKFDVAMVIPFFGDEAGYYIAQRFNASLVLYFTGQVQFHGLMKPWDSLITQLTCQLQFCHSLQK